MATTHYTAVSSCPSVAEEHGLPIRAVVEPASKHEAQRKLTVIDVVLSDFNRREENP